MSAAAIETEQLRKVFGKYAAVKGLTLQVPQGEVFGFLGPNGAGKTTSIKMLLGLISPSSGMASLLGKPIGDRDALTRIGFLPEHFRFQEWLTAREFLTLHGQLLRMKADDLLLESMAVEVCIDLRSGDACVPQHFLHGAQVGAGFHKMGRE